LGCSICGRFDNRAGKRPSSDLLVANQNFAPGPTNGPFHGPFLSSKPAEEAAKAKAAGYTAGNTAAQGAIDTGQAGADALYGQAYAPYTGLIDSTGRGAAAYGDASGANGAAGLASAKSLFTATPGLSVRLRPPDGRQRPAAASRGILASGNTIADTAKLATTYADQNYGNFVNRLSPYLSANNSAISGGAAVKGAQAATDMAAAGQRAQFGYNAATGELECQR
jgi:hypothetical protein